VELKQEEWDCVGVVGYSTDSGIGIGPCRGLTFQCPMSATTQELLGGGTHAPSAQEYRQRMPGL
jgi:hypothetical protein